MARIIRAENLRALVEKIEDEEIRKFPPDDIEKIIRSEVRNRLVTELREEVNDAMDDELYSY